MVAEGDLDGVEVLALDVLDDRHLQHGLGVGLADVGRHAAEPGALGRAEAALARDDLEPATAERADGDRLDDAELADAGGELVERFLVERLARLVRVRPDGLHVELGDAAEQADAVLEVVELGAGGVAFARVLAPLRGGGEQRAETFAERCFLRRHGGRE